jgi:hypothetical protein
LQEAVRGLTVSAAADDPLRWEQLCDLLQKRWQDAITGGAPRPRLGELLDSLSAAEREDATGVLLRVEWDVRDRLGDGPVVGEYLDRFPGHAELVRELAREVTFDPDMIPGYRLLREIGRGGSSVVYLADEFDPDGKPYRQVALQLTRRDCLDPQAADTRQEMGYTITSGIDHPRIVKVHRADRVNGRWFFTMPYYAGGTLLNRLKERRGPLPPREAAEICAQIAEAVEAMHRQDVLHLDIKPGNVLLDQAGRVYVADFNLARLMSAAGAEAPDRVSGTPPYMAPERLEGRRTRQCDVYSIGATLYELLTGRPPFLASTTTETVRQVREEPVTPPRKLNPELDGELERLCLLCLEKNPKDRYHTAGEVFHDLRHYLETGQGPLPPTFWRWLWRVMERKVHFEHGGVWSGITLIWAAYTLIGHGAMFLLLRAGAPGWGYWAWFAAFHVVGWVPLWVKLGRSGRSLDPTERGILLNWLGCVAADALLFALFCPLSGTPPPESVARVYPAWMTMHGLMWVMEARAYWGRFYLLGAGFFAAAGAMQFLLTLAPPFAALAFALVNAAALAWLAYALRNAARVTARWQAVRPGENPKTVRGAGTVERITS